MRKNKGLWPLTLTVMLTMLSAMSIVLGKLLAVNLGEVLRLSFENLPIIFAGLAFGPLAGAAVGLVADTVGCLLVGYAINPLVTCGAVFIGFASGAVSYMLKKKCARDAIRIGTSVAVAHVGGSVILKTVGLAMYYAMPLHTLMLWRALNYLLVGVAEGVALYFIMQNSGVKRAISSVRPTRKSSSGEDKEVNCDL